MMVSRFMLLRDYWLVGILLLAFILRLIMLYFGSNNPNSFKYPDSEGYLNAANHFYMTYFEKDSEFFSIGLKRTPGYPAFLMVFLRLLNKLQFVVFIQILIGLSVICLIYKTAEIIFDRKVAQVSALVLAVDPVSILYTNAILTEILFSLFLCLGLFCWVKGEGNNDYGKSGFFFGISVLVRPIALYLPLFFVPLLLFFNTQIGKMPYVLFLIMFLIPTGGWIARNYVIAEVPAISSIEGKNHMWRATAVMADANGYSFDHAKKVIKGQLCEDMKTRDSHILTDGEISKMEVKKAVSILMYYPYSTIKTALRGLIYTLFGAGRGPAMKLILGEVSIKNKTGFDLGSRNKVMVLLVLLEFGVLFLMYFGILSCLFFAINKGDVLKLWPIIAILCYFLVVSAHPGAYSRFRVPMAPFLAILSGYGYWHIYLWFSRRIQSKSSPQSN